jgi:membrane-associated phospholipid phosphatase
MHSILKGVLKIMSTTRSAHFVQLLLICVALTYCPIPIFAQTTDSNGGQAQEAQPVSGTLPSSQNTRVPSKETVICGPAHLGQCLKDIALDQAGIWTSPLRLKSRDAFWLVPFAGATAVAIHYDPRAQQELGIDKKRIDASNTISAFGSTYATIGAGSTVYLMGRLTHNDHLSETGRLGTEAVIDASLIAEALKLATNRERPDEGNGTGGFWPHGTRSFSDSFPSGHAIGSWALARVIAAEYPSKPTQIGVYAFATAISVSRVTSLKHFPSDALVGSVLGYLIGGYVVRHHAGQDFDSGLSFIPVVDVSTHTFGASVEVRPGQLDLAKVARLINRISGK